MLAADSLDSDVAAGSDSLDFELRSSAISGGMVPATTGGSVGGATGATAGVLEGAVEVAGVTTTDETLDLGSSGDSVLN